MNKEKPIRDQAERLRKKVERKSEHIVEKKDALPPRSEIHRQKQKKTKVKVKYPVIRLMALFFILLPISFFSILSYLDGANGPLNKTLERAGVEMINVESKDEGEDINNKEEEEAAPAFEEVSDAEDIEVVAAAPAHSNSGDKNSTETAAVGAEKEEKPSAVPAEKKEEQTNADSLASSSEEKIIYHTVKHNETLFRVAMNYYKSQDGIPIIQKANNLSGNEIHVGQVLKIPIKN
ncbi:LysM peptidoglycan-binding domain-containing protein [Mesobacillus jeotgali]|uniref:LysM peptidoglycan-binding domain-containing protein n=1 Tax=Mesobacillus jeotgali TaxID=129985 RepID=UPI0009A56400|nr:LysM peptidoglycan-binding domain-containing protein [Mesobacillus jeotgali]